MNSPTSRDVELAVAGALAAIGFNALTGLLFMLASHPTGIARSGASALTAIALPIGILMMLRPTVGLTVARIYLWLHVISAAIAIPLYARLVPSLASRLWREIPAALFSFALLGLLAWSRTLARNAATTAESDET